jgi:hypothetical protein
MSSPKDDASGTNGQSPQSDGPQQNTARRYIWAKDNPDKDRDANGESNSDREVKKVSDAFMTKDG